MACNTCNKIFSFLRKERGCPGCGFSYCSNCLKHKIFLTKSNQEAKVCAKCFTQDHQIPRVPPDDFLKGCNQETFKRQSQHSCVELERGTSAEDQVIADRLRKLREKDESASTSTDREISERLQKLSRDQVLNVTTEELRDRLSKLRGEASASTTSQLPAQDLRSDQEKVDDVICQYMEEVKIDASHKKDFDAQINEIQSRLAALTGEKVSNKQDDKYESDSETEEDCIKKVIEKAKAEAALRQQSTSSEDKPFRTVDTSELPWCEICNEDATMRCLGCRYLFCRACFSEHIDDDCGCDKWEPYIKHSNGSEL